MKLTLHITGESPAWQIVLQQLGLPFKTIDPGEGLTPETTAVLAIAAAPSRLPYPALRNYLWRGGAVLIEADLAEKVFDIPSRRRRLRYVHARSDEPLFGNVSLVDLNRRCRVAAAAQHLPDQGGRPTIATLRYGNGTLVVLPGGLLSAITGNRRKRTNFPPAGGKRPPSERIANVAKGGVRQIVELALAYLYHSRSLPLVQLWPFPHGAAGVWGFRIDTDFSSPEAVESLYHLCRNYKIPATWFVETRSCRGWLSVYRDMQAQEIAYHCYRHRVFPDDARNVRDFQRGLALLEEQSLKPTGYAAPYGEWHPRLGRLLERLGFSYSSEFALAYDDRPFFPHLGEGFSAVLQVPIHPISVGRLYWARHTETDMVDYFRRVIRQKLALHEPIFLYHHPGQGRLSLFEKIFRELTLKGIPRLSLGEYARWWRSRLSTVWEAEISENQLRLHSPHSESGLWVKISPPEAASYLVPLNEAVPVRASEKRVLRESSLPYFDPRPLRRYSKQMLVHDLTWHYGRAKQ